MLNLPERFILFDLEWTTWEGAEARNWSREGEHMEVVQAGAALLDGRHMEELESINVLIRPQFNPILSQYFIDLTGITQEEIEQKGIDFRAFLKIFLDFCSELPIYCFGRADGGGLSDYDVLVKNCELLEMKFPLARTRFHNINEIFHQHGYEIEQSGSSPEAFGIELPFRPHDALNDVRAVLIALRALNERLK